MTLYVGDGVANRVPAQIHMSHDPGSGLVNVQALVAYMEVGGVNKVVWARTPEKAATPTFSGVGFSSPYVTAGFQAYTGYTTSAEWDITDNSTGDPISWFYTTLGVNNSIRIETSPQQVAKIRVRARLDHDSRLDSHSGATAHESVGPWSDWAQTTQQDTRSGS